MRTVIGQGTEPEEDELGMELRVISETDKKVEVGVTFWKEWLRKVTPGLVAVIEAGCRTADKP